MSDAQPLVSMSFGQFLSNITGRPMIMGKAIHLDALCIINHQYEAQFCSFIGDHLLLGKS
jgi:hypothetical protein